MDGAAGRTRFGGRAGIDLLTATTVYSVLVVVLTWPLALRLRVLEPGDTSFFAWAMSWEIHALTTDPTRLPDGNIYHPAHDTLGMDEPVLGTTLLALPVSLVTRDAALLFNVTRLLTYLGSALAAWALARWLGVGAIPALVAGALFAFSPIRTDKIAHLNTLGSQWLPLSVLFLFRFARNGRARDALWAGAFFVLTAYACGYYGMIGLLVLPAAALPLMAGRWRRLLRALPAVLLSAAALVPLQRLHRAAFGPESFSRSRDDAVFYAASLESFLATSSENRLYGEWTTPFRTEGSNNLFPGLVPLGLAAFGALLLWRRRRRPSREALSLAVMAAVAALVALGPEVRLFGQTLAHGPYGWVRELAPVFEGIRVTSRAGIYIALPLALLAALALRAWNPGQTALTIVAVAALAETLVIPIPSWAPVIDSSQPPPPVYEWLARQPGEFALLELPIIPADGKFSRPAFDETIYMVRSTLHWKRLVNGNAGVEPLVYRHVRDLASHFPSEALFLALRSLDVKLIVLHEGGYGPNKRARLARELPRFEGTWLRRVASFPESTVFELVGSSPPPEP